MPAIAKTPNSRPVERFEQLASAPTTALTRSLDYLRTVRADPKRFEEDVPELLDSLRMDAFPGAKEALRIQEVISSLLKVDRDLFMKRLLYDLDEGWGCVKAGRILTVGDLVAEEGGKELPECKNSCINFTFSQNRAKPLEDRYLLEGADLCDNTGSSPILSRDLNKLQRQLLVDSLNQVFRPGCFSDSQKQ